MKKLLSILFFLATLSVSAQIIPRFNATVYIPQATPPTPAFAGMVYVDSDDDLLYIYDGSTWSAIGTGGGGGSVAWGGITGTLADQSDLNTALNGKAALTGADFTGDVTTTGSFSLNDGVSQRGIRFDESSGDLVVTYETAVNSGIYTNVAKIALDGVIDDSQHLITKAEADANYAGGGSGDFLADGSVPMTGGLQVNNADGVLVSVQGTADGTISTAATIGFSDSDTDGETAKLIFGDDDTSIVAASGSGLGLRSYWTMFFQGGYTGQESTDADDYDNIARVGYNFLLNGTNSVNSRALRLTERNSTFEGDMIEGWSAEGSQIWSINEAGLFTGTVDYDNTTSGLTATNTEAAIDELAARTEVIAIACSDLTTDITTGTTKGYIYMPYAATLEDVEVSLLTAGTTTGITVDINEAGVSVLSTLLTTDATENLSDDATTAAVISDSALADNALITIDFDAVPTGGQGVIVYLYVTR